MASFINKRQQARNERTLQELIRSVPGNDRCADCAARNPGWASWNLGIFLCMRCAALHRKMGTHISKVKSLSMDTWSSDQVESMKHTGNTASNRIFNPRNIKPTIPVDSDEADSAMERFIREKYQTRTIATGAPQVPARHATGSTTSSEDRPPPPPPKTGLRFMPNLRSTSSQYPSTGSSEVGEPGTRAVASKTSSSNLRSARSNMDLKLQQLQEMGFMDSARNATVLKGVDGNVQRAVEALVRLGEGTSVNGVTVAKSQTQANSTHAHTSSPPLLQQPQQPFQQQQTAVSSHYSPSSNFTPQPPLSAVSSFPSVPPAVSPPKSMNPFDPPGGPTTSAIPNQTLQQSFQNLQVSAQPLFPHNTGNFQAQNNPPNNPFLTSVGPSPSSQPQYGPINPLQGQPQPALVQQPPQTQANPFLRTSRSQNFASTNPFGQPARAQTFDTAFTQNQNAMQPTNQSPFSNTLYQSQPQQLLQQSPVYQSPVQSPQHTGIWNQSSGSSTYPPPQQQQQGLQQSMYNPQFPQQQQPPQVQSFYQQPAIMMPQQTGRFDKNSILALYNQPQLAPARPAAMAQPSIPEESEISHQTSQQTQQGLARSVTMPVVSTGVPSNPQPNMGTMNPFSNLVVPGISARPTSRGHLSKESADIAGYMSGRHSPDAFSGLSARAGR